MTSRALARLEVIQQHRQCLRFLSIILHHNTTRPNNLASISLTIKHTKSSPLSKLLPISNLDEVNIMFGAKSLNKLIIRLRVARLGKHSKMGLTTTHKSVKSVRDIPVERFGALTETTSESVMDKGTFEDIAKGILDGHA
jgi:hypothetical protein